MRKLLAELIEGGTLAQALLVVLIWGAITYLMLTKGSAPDALINAGMIVLGYYFRSTAQVIANVREGTRT